MLGARPAARPGPASLGPLWLPPPWDCAAVPWQGQALLVSHCSSKVWHPLCHATLRQRQGGPGHGLPLDWPRGVLLKGFGNSVSPWPLGAALPVLALDSVPCCWSRNSPLTLGQFCGEVAVPGSHIPGDSRVRRPRPHSVPSTTGMGSVGSTTSTPGTWASRPILWPLARAPCG